MNVYIAIRRSINCDDYSTWVGGVFSTPEKAEGYVESWEVSMQKLKEHPYNNLGDDFDVDTLSNEEYVAFCNITERNMEFKPYIQTFTIDGDLTCDILKELTDDI